MMHRRLLIGTFLLSCLSMPGQESDYLNLVKGETELKGLFEQLYSDSIKEPQVVLDRIQEMMPEILALPGAMDFPWNGLDRIGVKGSEDGQLRIFTWHWMDDPDSYRYFGYMQVAQKKGKIRVEPLEDNLLPQQGLYELDQSTGNWYGKLVYGIVTSEHKRKTYYTLLGMDFNHSRSNLKMVEMWTLQRGKPQFVKKAFSNGKEVVDRVVLEYSSQVAISVRYDSMHDMIVYDHLVPLHAVYENNFEFYGPDGSFDGLTFEEGTWYYQEDVDARMPY
jgi:hypothetical protein